MLVEIASLKAEQAQAAGGGVDNDDTMSMLSMSTIYTRKPGNNF
jgi:hypothetical protein